MALFERGMELATLCEGMLDRAELRVEQIMRGADGEAVLAPFSGQE
jgi:exonuclease VII small subunit